MNTTSQMPQWVREFGEGYAVPAVIAHDPRLFDISWHNDVCPSFVIKGTEDSEAVVRLWVDHVDAEMREITTAARFYVFDYGGISDAPIYEGEDADAALAAMFSYVRVDA